MSLLLQMVSINHKCALIRLSRNYEKINNVEAIATVDEFGFSCSILPQKFWEKQLYLTLSERSEKKSGRAFFASQLSSLIWNTRNLQAENWFCRPLTSNTWIVLAEYYFLRLQFSNTWIEAAEHLFSRHLHSNAQIIPAKHYFFAPALKHSNWTRRALVLLFYS